MSLSSTINRVAYIGDGSSAVFAFPYYFFNQADLNVYLYDTLLGGIQSQALNTNYTISGSVNAQGLYSSGGNVVMASAIVSTSYVVITRNPSPVQTFVLQQNGNVPSVALTQEMDYLTLLTQRQQDQGSRSVRLNDGYQGSFSPILPTPIGSSLVLAINSSATGFEFINPDGSGEIGTAGYVFTGNGPGVPATFKPVTLSGSSVSGVLNLGNGGTGGVTPQVYGVIYCSSSTQLETTNPGPSGFALVSNASSAPSFKQINLALAGSGFLPIANGGTGGNSYVSGSGALQISSYISGSGALLIGNNLSEFAVPSTAFKNISPLTTTGDIIIYGSNATQVRLAASNSSYVLTSGGASVQPSWQPSATGFSNPMTTLGDMLYTGSAAVATRLAGSITGSTAYLSQVGTGSLSAAPSWKNISSPTVQVFTTGSSVYTLPTGAVWIKVRLIGGGGGGAGTGSAASGGSGGNAIATTFISSSVTLSGGGGVGGTNVGGTGGTSSGGDVNLSGAQGGPRWANVIAALGGYGAGSFFGGGGYGGEANGGNGGAAAVNTGAGGGGGGSTTTTIISGPGGGAGGYCEKIIRSPVTNYNYVVSPAGAQGTSGSSGVTGGAGGSGLIIVEEYYQ